VDQPPSSPRTAYWYSNLRPLGYERTGGRLTGRIRFRTCTSQRCLGFIDSCDCTASRPCRGVLFPNLSPIPRPLPSTLRRPIHQGQSLLGCVSRKQCGHALTMDFCSRPQPAEIPIVTRGGSRPSCRPRMRPRRPSARGWLCPVTATPGCAAGVQRTCHTADGQAARARREPRFCHRTGRTTLDGADVLQQTQDVACVAKARSVRARDGLGDTATAARADGWGFRFAVRKP
jgi:hypothetical protein